MSSDQNLDILVKELSSYIDTFEDNLIALEADEDPKKHIEEISRLLHSCKGILGFAGPTVSSVIDLIHKFEDRILDYSDTSSVDEKLISDMFDLIDGLKELVDILLENPTSSQVDNCFNSLIDTSPKLKTETEYRLTIFLPPNMKMKSTRALSYLNVLKRKSTIRSVEPSTEMLYDNFEDFDKLEIILLTKENLDFLRDLVKRLPNIESYDITEIKHTGKRKDPLELHSRSSTHHYSMNQTEMAKISNIMEEFLRIEKLLHKLDLDSLEKYEKKLISSFKRKILDIQEAITMAQKVPLSLAFGSLQRVARDIAKKYDKSIQLYISGDHYRLDRSIVEKLSDPLVVLLQNAIIHGIEIDNEREKMNKSVPAIIRIEALQDSGNTIIRVFDNGRGIDYEKVWNKGVELGIAKGEFNQEKAKQLLFASSFSTADEVSTEAGRGMGLYHVKQFVLDVNGKVNVTSTEGQNTIFEMVFPVQNNISSVILVNLNGQKFAFPETHVQKIYRLKEGIVETNGNNQAFLFKLMNDEIKTINLPAAFEKEEMPLSDGAVLLWDNGLDRIGFYVHNIVTFEEMAINYLDPVAEISSLFSGTASLGTGDVVFLLQPHEFINI